MLDECRVVIDGEEDPDYGRMYVALVDFYDARRMARSDYVLAHPSRGEDVIRRFQDELGPERERELRKKIQGGATVVRRATLPRK